MDSRERQRRIHEQHPIASYLGDPDNVVTIRLPKFLQPRAARRHAKRLANEQSRQTGLVDTNRNASQQVLNSLLGSLVKAFPEHVDPSITETQVDDLSTTQLEHLRVAGSWMLSDSLGTYIDARDELALLDQPPAEQIAEPATITE
ncbi:MAG TPA: hypothetical protein VIH90_05485 [Candidatus Saccharimonadales bacterium]